MKKILLSIGLLAASLVNAQENWLSVEQSGFPSQATFRLSQVFQGKLYVAGDSPGHHLVLYSSPSGDAASFLQADALTSVLLSANENQFYSSAANSSYMFLGSQTYFDTTGGVTGTVPQVHRFDGSTYTKHGTINCATLPANNQLVSGYNPQIDALALFSPTGASDSIYAFINTGSGNNVSVWKAPANQTNPTWINVTNFSMGS